MSNEVSFETYQWASGHYLTQPLPDNWYDMTTENQNDFLKNIMPVTCMNGGTQVIYGQRLTT
jgi:hypothetical protein